MLQVPDNATVNTLNIINNNVIVGGSFLEADDQYRNNFVQFDVNGDAL